MHYPMSRSEIATFLGVSASHVELFWRSGQLRKSLSCPYRPVEALNYSSVYDVLECALTLRASGTSLPTDVAAVWIELMAEADDYGEAATHSMAKRSDHLLGAAIDVGIADLSPDPGAIARDLVFQQNALMQRCYQA